MNHVHTADAQELSKQEQEKMYQKEHQQHQSARSYAHHRDNILAQTEQTQEAAVEITPAHGVADGGINTAQADEVVERDTVEVDAVTATANDEAKHSSTTQTFVDEKAVDKTTPERAVESTAVG